MVFSSNLFILAFLPIFFLVYYVLPYRFKNAWALLASTAFYAWGAPLFVFVLFASITLDFALVKRLKNSLKPKINLWVAIVANVGLLAYFKYANFFVENFNKALGKAGFEELGWLEVALPIGISFFTFQKISYVLDVYRGVRPPLKNWQDYALYVLLFPQLIAGPIVRYNDIADEIIDRKKKINADNRLLGLFRFAIGLGKKVLIANVLGAEADRIFDIPPSSLNTTQAWYGAVCYTFQIYFDFSGYSDMAIGLGRMMGFTFPENFNNPYVSKSITEFWRRWHISLSNWMRDYLYISLGGNRVSERRLYLNLWLVFLISGLWHGAAWTFIIWGAYHGLFLVLERKFLSKLYKRLPAFIPLIITFILVIFGWVFFRASSLEAALVYIKAMMAFSFGGLVIKLSVKTAFLVAAAGSFMALLPSVEKWQNQVLFKVPGLLKSTLMAVFTGVILVICISVIAASGFNPFIYFRF